MAFDVRRRVRDIGVRMAPGAERGLVVRQVLTRALRMAVIGGVTGLGTAMALAGALSSMLWGIGPRVAHAGGQAHASRAQSPRNARIGSRRAARRAGR